MHGSVEKSYRTPTATALGPATTDLTYVDLRAGTWMRCQVRPSADVQAAGTPSRSPSPTATHPASVTSTSDTDVAPSDGTAPASRRAHSSPLVDVQTDIDRMPRAPSVVKARSIPRPAVTSVAMDRPLPARRALSTWRQLEPSRETHTAATPVSSSSPVSSRATPTATSPCP